MPVGMLLCIALFSNPLLAANASAIGQSFKTTDKNVGPGALVGLTPSTPDSVQLATQEHTDKLVGVVGANPLIAISDNPSSVQVITSGVTVTVVSDVNGAIKTGDAITTSPIAGVGMRATDNGVVIGAAQADLSSVKTTTRTIKATDGSEQTVHVGLIPVQISVVFYAAPDAQKTFLPAFLQDFANTVAGREVSPVRVMIAGTVMLLSFLSIGVLLYASVKSSIISIGRNPLSEVSVRKSLIQIGMIVLGILLLGLSTIYLILTT
ncbi:MAG TPA: hypothetical protein VLG40_03120 [Candidatus Saccharimonas sp.]|nr:hypothetical protein [Candidatus Saccharimonas sp.]